MCTRNKFLFAALKLNPSEAVQMGLLRHLENTAISTAAPSGAASTQGWSDFVAMVAVAIFMILVFFALLRLSKKWTEIM